MNLRTTLRSFVSRVILVHCFLTGGMVTRAFAFDHTHAVWTTVLKRVVVKDGPASRVKYAQLVSDSLALDEYTKSVSEVTKDEYAKWTEPQRLAFLFNSYNAFTLKLVVQELKSNPGLKSIKKIGGLFSSPWKIRFFDFLGNKSYLDEIEQVLARPLFDEPRMHFAFNCASIGCPALQTEAFTADHLSDQLDRAAREFLSDTSRNRYVANAKKLELSMIFKWYGDDFDKSKRFGPKLAFVSSLMPLDANSKEAIRSGQAQVSYLDYDWNLNRQ